eukprot:4874799-Amphidinium_carterae.1
MFVHRPIMPPHFDFHWCRWHQTHAAWCTRAPLPHPGTRCAHSTREPAIRASCLRRIGVG